LIRRVEGHQHEHGSRKRHRCGFFKFCTISSRDSKPQP
jgi:hypothetical protein